MTTPQTPPASPTPSAPSPQPSTPPSNALKIVLILLGAIVVLVVVGLSTVWWIGKSYLEKNVSIRATPGGQAEVEISTPSGQVSISGRAGVTEEQLGVPIYPGAAAGEGGAISISGTTTQGTGAWSAATFETTDSYEKVVEFYRTKFGGGVHTVSVQDNEGKRATTFHVAKHEAKLWKMIVISEEDGKTKIVISNMEGRGVQ